jgi:hypothetical protein
MLLAQAVVSPELVSSQSGIVSGKVTAANNMPIADARIQLLGTGLTAVTRVDGGFKVGAVPAGAQTIEVRRVGYAPASLVVDLAEGATVNLSLVLEPLPLETVSVLADTRFSPGMGGFEERRSHGNGRFFTREEIEKMQARQITDVLRRVPGIRIQSGEGAFGGSQTAQTGRNTGSGGSRICPMAYYVNGTPFPLSRDVSINHYFTPDDIAAIEVYTGPSQVPVQFNANMSTSRCGVVVIWTRIGTDGRVAR